MATRRDKLRRRVELIEKHGPEEAACKLGIKVSTIKRDYRRARSVGLVDDDTINQNKRREELKKRAEYAKKNGKAKAAKKYDVSVRTIGKYERQAKQEGLVIPKILLFDIETSPLEVYAWRTGKQYVGTKQIIKPWSILTWSAKWLCDDEIIGDRVSANKARNRKDKRIIKKLWDLFDEADIIIAHNLKNFDKKKANSRFILNDFDPPSPYQMVDTLKEARKEFKFVSNKLGYLGKILTNSEKQKTEYNLWKRCVTGDVDALRELLAYNKQDVSVLEDVYLKIRPWIHSHPNLALYFEKIGEKCPNCGSDNLKEGKKHYFTPTGKYKTIRCKDCGAVGRDRYMDLTTAERKELYRSNAK